MDAQDLLGQNSCEMHTRQKELSGRAVDFQALKGSRGQKVFSTKNMQSK